MEGSSKGAPRWIAGVEPAKEILGYTGTQVLAMECRQQPEKLRALLAAYAGDASILAEIKKLGTLAARPGPVMFIGMGASYCSSFAGSALLAAHGRMAFSVDAGEWLNYGSRLWDQAGLSILLTASGESAELVEFVRQAGERPLALICNNPASACWQLAQNKLPILAGPEYGNATKTYINATAAAIVTAAEIAGHPWQAEAAQAADVFSAHLEPIFAAREELERFCRGAANIEVIGRGAAYGGAFMSALCIREMSGFRAAPHTGAGFKHGPNLDVDGSHVAIIFALGHVAELGFRLAAECNRRGGKVVLVAEEPGTATANLFPVQMPAVAEPWEAITCLLVPQALTLAMVERTGCRLPPRFQYAIMEQ